jgi:hypothetical protein
LPRYLNCFSLDLDLDHVSQVIDVHVVPCPGKAVACLSRTITRINLASIFLWLPPKRRRRSGNRAIALVSYYSLTLRPSAGYRPVKFGAGRLLGISPSP